MVFIRGLLVLIVFQLLGTVISQAWLPLVPGPVIGLLLLFAWCVWNKGPGKGTVSTSMTLLTMIALMLIPSAVTLITYYEGIADQLVRLVVAIVLSQLLAIWFCGRLMQYLIRRRHAK